MDERDAECRAQCRGILEEINEHLQSSFCIYAVQFVPCMYLGVLNSEQKGSFCI